MCADIDCTATTAHSSSEQPPRTRPDVFQAVGLARPHRSDEGEEPTTTTTTLSVVVVVRDRSVPRRPRAASCTGRPFGVRSPCAALRRRLLRRSRRARSVVSYARPRSCRVVAAVTAVQRSPFSVSTFRVRTCTRTRSLARVCTRTRARFVCSSLPFVAFSPVSHRTSSDAQINVRRRTTSRSFGKRLRIGFFSAFTVRFTPEYRRFVERASRSKRRRDFSRFPKHFVLSPLLIT